MTNHTVHWIEAEREQVLAEALHHPETAEEWATQQARFSAWLKDRRYQHLWPMLEKLVHAAPAAFVSAPTPQPAPVAK
jgi:hypothetical protein